MKDLNRKTSIELFKLANSLMPGGVNSPVRAFKAVELEPVFIKKAEGSKLYDEDGNEYIDYVLSWGPMILGHAYSKVVTAIKEAVNFGTSFGACHKKEIELAQLIMKAFDSIEMIRFVNSGTEAVMSAIRLARGYTKKDFIVKFDGCYHGHYDDLLVNAGSGLSTFGISSSLGVPEAHTKNTISLPFNDINIFKDVIKKQKDKISCVIVEPIPANMGLILPHFTRGNNKK